MVGKKLILFLFFLFGMVMTSYGQTVPYTYVDPCTGVLTTVQVPSTSGTVTMFYGGQYQTFTYAQLQAGAYDQWVNSINAQFPPGTDPCAGQGEVVVNNFNTQLGSQSAGNVANITSIIQMAAGLANSTSGAANTAGGISTSLGSGSSSGDGNSSSGGSDDNNDDGGDGNGSSSNSGTNTGGSTGSSSSSGGSTSTGGNSGSGTSTGGSTGGGSGTSTGSGSSTGGSTGTGGSGSSGSGGGSTGGSGSSGGGSTGGGGNTGGGSTGTGGSGSGDPNVGIGGTGGNTGTNDGGSTEGASELGGMGDQTTTTASGGESESGGDGGSGGGGGRRKNKQEKVGRGALIGAGDFVIIRNSANIRDTGMDNFKFNASLTHLNSKQTFIKGANFNYQTGEKIGNLTLYGSLKTEKNMFIFSNSTMTNFTSDWFNTTSVMDALRINKITLMGGTNYTYGYLGKGEFSNWSIIGGGFTNFTGGRSRVSSNVMLLSVYSPYIFYYEGQWYRSGFLFIPLINNDIKVTDTFKWSISFAGVYQLNGSVLNWQLSTGTKILL